MISAPRRAEEAPELDDLRQQIERIDRALIDLVADRVSVARRLAEVKRAAGMPVLDPGREAEVVRRAAEHARERQLPDEDVRDIFWRIIGVSRRSQSERR